jgi:hypothetical protein
MTTSWKMLATITGVVVIAAFAPSVSTAGAQAPAAADTTTQVNAPKGPWGYHGASSIQGYQPEQPIKFPHPVHVQKVGMNCQYCHFAANKSPDPGMPAVGTCMGCHLLVKTTSPEVQKIAKYWADKKPIPWVRIHKVPDYVQFPHMRHVSAGVTCQSCHGQIQKMPQVFQYASLNMGWCVNCHVNGYDPAKGDLAAGYTKDAAGGFKLAAAPDAAPSASSRLMGMFVREAKAQAPTPPGGAAPAAGQIRKARYDCAVCHY